MKEIASFRFESPFHIISPNVRSTADNVSGDFKTLRADHAVQLIQTERGSIKLRERQCPPLH